jgi:Rieske Fe-S protein
MSVVVTQVTEGEFKAFSAVCTHQGCLVGCRDKEIVCDCHASFFDPTNGKVLSGPAPTPLPEIPIEVRDGVIYTACPAPRLTTHDSRLSTWQSLFRNLLEILLAQLSSRLKEIEI